MSTETISPVALPSQKTSETNEAYTIPKRLKSTQQLLELVQGFISLILGLTALITLSGFIIVNTYLAKYTDIHGYNTAPSQYIAAGIGFWTFSFLGAGIIYLFYYKTDPALYRALAKRHNTPSSEEAIRAKINSPFNLKVNLTAAIINGLIGGYTYGALIYEDVSRYIGGGKPATITLILKEEYPLSWFGLPQDEANEYKTDKILLLAELNDGLLVAVEGTGQILAVKNDAIIALLDDTPAQLLVIPEVTPPPTPDATPPMSNP